MTQAGLQPRVADLSALVQFADQGIVSKTVCDTPFLKLILFCFETGQALSEHAAPFEAVIHVVQGKASVKLGGSEHEAKPGAVYVMPAGLPHSLVARERLVFLLTLVKPQSVVQIRD